MSRLLYSSLLTAYAEWSGSSLLLQEQRNDSPGETEAKQEVHHSDQPITQSMFEMDACPEM